MPLSADEQSERLKYLTEVYKLYHGHINTMFNYFLIVIGLIANAYVQALLNEKIELAHLAAMIAFIGALVSIIALKIHQRSRQFLDTIEAALTVEETQLFRAEPGFLISIPTPASPLARHKGQFLAMYWIAILSFFLGAIYAESRIWPQDLVRIRCIDDCVFPTMIHGAAPSAPSSTGSTSR